MAMPETLKEWKMAIMSARQGYESTEDAMITRQAQELHMVVEDNQWILGDLMTISKTGNQSVSIATNTVT